MEVPSAGASAGAGAGAGLGAGACPGSRPDPGPGPRPSLHTRIDYPGKFGGNRNPKFKGNSGKARHWKSRGG